MYYDKYGRVVQTRASNHLGGYDITYNALDFTGKPSKTYKTHGINGALDTYTELYKYDYDKAQRPTTTKYSLNGGSLMTMAVNTYDELGRIKTKTLGGVDATTYAYNIRNWTTDIVGTRFSENLYYNANTVGLPNFTPAYNGNIAGMQWSVANESGSRAYSFTYDGLNRLTDAIYTGFSGGVINGTQNRYDEHFGFDKMGNTTSFTRNGLLSSSGGYGTIDNLSFTYNGNQKLKITDSGTNGIFYGDEEFVQNGTNTGNSCAYDANGNRLYDSNSNIWGIRYNTLNLPDAMQFYQGHQTNYTYSAAGAKLKVIDKTAPAGVVLPVTSLNTILSNPSVSTITTTDYVGNMIYENGSLKRILTSVGYWQAGTFYYFLKDHLGSNQVVINGSGGIAETSSYYPSGMRFGESAVNGGSVQPYRHTGHEMQEMHGLNWIDNVARFRTVSDGSGFTGVDPLAELYSSVSPYAYCLGNPMKYADNNGMWPTKKAVDNGRVGRGFSPTPVWNPAQKIFRPHYGQDLPAAEGNNVRALAKGKVIKIGWDPNGWGNYVIVNHEGGYTSLYGHLSEILVKLGVDISNGGILALSGKTGKVKGAHLHLEIKLNRVYKNPLSIDDLQKLLNGEEFDNEDHPCELGELIVVAKNPNPEKTLEQRMKDLEWFSVRPNQNGNTGRYNMPNRSSDQFYSDDILKWYYNRDARNDSSKK